MYNIINIIIHCNEKGTILSIIIYCTKSDLSQPSNSYLVSSLKLVKLFISTYPVIVTIIVDYYLLKLTLILCT